MSGHVTGICGQAPPLSPGYTGYSPAGPCEGVCYSGWTDGTCTDPADAGSRVVVYGCPGKTYGGSCDGDHNGGVLLGTYDAGQPVSISSFIGAESFCTFQLDVLRPNGGDPIGLRDFLLWERDDCSSTPPPDPSCHCPNGMSYQDIPVTGTSCGQLVCGKDFKWYSCEANGWTNQHWDCPEPPPDPTTCACSGGTDYLGNSASGTPCGDRICGGDFQWYACDEGSWVFEGGECPDEEDTWTAVSVGGYHSCGLRTDGSAACWGRNTSGQALPSVAGPFLQISAGYDYTCALRTNRDVTCWGSNVDGQAPVHVSGPFLTIDTYGKHACGVLMSGALSCWGDLWPGSIPSGTFKDIAVGAFHVCGLRNEGTLTCWGGESYGMPNAPSGPFIDVEAGYASNCALTTEGSASCWGENYWGESDDQPGPIAQISKFFPHTCALLPDGQVDCWGDVGPYAAGYSIPGTFTQVSAGQTHNCALSTGGQILCWGNDSYGQLQVPN
ncbi:BNR repeat domain protein [Chondromyces apiculatus DSM 436]|uniref:non-specific serine/threonine protein kinase n=2 Tax=Chondromyces apiculatus TaxID=51 RepID=A0A017TC41_9BACT|nr:BNR repeat domain protein [Chondromyces apiculatus DSM 436]